MISLNLITPPIAEPVTLAQAKLQCSVSDSFTAYDALFGGWIIAARQHAEKMTHRVFLPQTWRLGIDYFPVWWGSSTINPAFREGFPFLGNYWETMAIRLPRPHTLSVDSINYRDLNSDPQTLDSSDYYVDLDSEPCRIIPTPGLTWPVSATYLPGSVQVQYTSGSYVTSIPDSLTVPSQAPYKINLSQTPVWTVALTTSAGDAVSFTQENTSLTVDASYAGQTLTATYYAANVPQTVQQAILLLISHWWNHRSATSETTLSNIPLGVNALLSYETINLFGFGNGF